jgi:hypothetical protein
MTKLPLYHQTATDGHGGIPAWWFIGLVLSVALVTAWQVVRWGRARRLSRHDR